MWCAQSYIRSLVYSSHTHSLYISLNLVKNQRIVLQHKASQVAVLHNNNINSLKRYPRPFVHLKGK